MSGLQSVVLALALAAIVSPAASNAQSQPAQEPAQAESLAARVRVLEAELAAALDQLRSPSASAALASPPSPPRDALAALEERLEQLDQQIRVVSRLAELEKERLAQELASAPRVVAGRDGFALRSADGDFQLKLRGYLHADGRFYAEGRGVAADTFLMRRVRPIVEGTLFGNVAFRVMPDFGGGSASLQDAYVDLTFTPAVKLRAGKFKSPVGYERLMSATTLPFVERALPTLLVPNRDVGIQLFGAVAGQAVSYELGLFNGVIDGASADLDDGRGKDVVARLFVEPFRSGRNETLKQLGLGIAASYGDQDGTLTAPGLPTFRSTAQQVFARYRTDGTAEGTALADGTHWRVSPQGHFYAGRLGAFAECVFSSQHVRRDAQRAVVDNTAWQVSARYVLTGEKASPRGLEPQRAFDTAAGGWGALEATARYHALSLDDAAVRLFANPASAATDARAWDAGINWYLNRAVKLTAQYQETRFDGGAADGHRATERAFLTRVQLGF